MSELTKGNLVSPGARVRAARESLGITREALAARSSVSTSTVARLELQDRLPRVQSLVDIATAVGLDAASLIAPDAGDAS